MKRQENHEEPAQGPEHEDLGVGEVDHPQNPVDHGVAQGDEGVDRAQRQAVHELFNEKMHLGKTGALIFPSPYEGEGQGEGKSRPIASPSSLPSPPEGRRGFTQQEQTVRF